MIPRPPSRTLALLLTAVALGACTYASPADEDGPSYDRYLINEEMVDEFLVHSEGSAWDVVEYFRSRWLRPQNTGGIYNRRVTPAVFVDEVRRGGIDSLREINSDRILRIEFIPAREAGVRYGTGYVAGIIMVRTRSR